jgi:hypothetical protein
MRSRNSRYGQSLIRHNTKDRSTCTAPNPARPVRAIVPFLVWFHLQGENTARARQGQPLLRLPTMHQVIPPRWFALQLYGYLATLPLVGLAAIAWGLTRRHPGTPARPAGEPEPGPPGAAPAPPPGGSPH